MGKLYVVATPIGNLSDISTRALETLRKVNLILCEDTRHSLKLLNFFQIKNHLMSYHKFNENKVTPSIINKLKDNDIALITDAGTPCISDPGYILINEARKNNIEVIGIPGCSAVINALSISGFNTDSFSFYGFFPKENKDKKEFINTIKNNNTNCIVMYESPKRILKTLNYLKEELVMFNILVCSDLTKLHEKSYFGNINEVINILENNEKVELGEYTIIVENKNKKDINNSVDNLMSIESLIVDIMIKNKLSLKESIVYLNKNSSFSKKDIYNASLNLKNILIYK